MNKEFEKEMIQKIKEPIIVNSVNYKFFDEDNYNKICYFIENEQSYIEYLEFENKSLNERIDKTIEILNKWNEEYNGLLNKNVIYISEKEDDLFSLLKVLKGE